VLLLLTTLSLFVPMTPGAGAEDFPTIDGRYSSTGPLQPREVRELVVTGRGGVPSTGVGAVALNVTATNVTARSYLTVFPTGRPRPLAANLVFDPGATVPNMVVVDVGVDGKISIFGFAGTTDVVVDVLGWFPSGAAFRGVTPARLMDTRPGQPTVDGVAAGAGPLRAGAPVDLTVTGRGGVPGAGVGAVALNVTSTGATADSYLVAWPAGSPRPNAANLNIVAGGEIANVVIAKVGAGGRVSIANYAGATDVVVDVLGWFPEGSGFTGVSPGRVLDTRPGYATLDGAWAGVGSLRAGGTLELPVVGRAGVPAGGVAAVAVNIAVTEPTQPSFLTAFPTGAPRPTAANLNFVAGQTVPNMAILKVGTGGRISLYNLAGQVHVVVDVLGWFAADGSFVGLTPARLMDSRLSPNGPTSVGSGPPVPPPPPPPPPTTTPSNPNGFTRPLVSIDFDDGWKGAYTLGLPIVESFGFRTTQYIITDAPPYGDYMNDEEIRAWDRHGDVGSHTVDHTGFLADMEPAELERQLRDSDLELQALLGRPVDLLATPYCSWDQEVIAEARRWYTAMRNCDRDLNRKGSVDPWNIKSVIVDADTTRAEVRELLARTKAEGAWLVLVYHDVQEGAPRDDVSITPAALRMDMQAVADSGIAVVPTLEALQEVLPQR